LVVDGCCFELATHCDADEVYLYHLEGCKLCEYFYPLEYLVEDAADITGECDDIEFLGVEGFEVVLFIDVGVKELLVMGVAELDLWVFATKQEIANCEQFLILLF
jgi:hypothetical protein